MCMITFNIWLAYLTEDAYVGSTAYSAGLSTYMNSLVFIRRKYVFLELPKA